MASNLIKTSSLVLAALVALTVQVFYFSPIDPITLEIPSAASSTSSSKNNQLQVKILSTIIASVQNNMYLIVYDCFQNITESD
jgi:hypothetical protein